MALLRALLARRTRDAALGCIWDPVAVEVCAEAGEGARLPLRLGGKCGTASGQPLDVEVTVRRVRDDHSQTGRGDSRVPMGRSVWLAADEIDIVVNSIRTQTFAPDAFTGLGIALDSKRVIAVKSSWHFHAHFAPLASRVIPLATPGALQMDFAAIPYQRRRSLNYFPRVHDPLAAA